MILPVLGVLPFVRAEADESNLSFVEDFTFDYSDHHRDGHYVSSELEELMRSPIPFIVDIVPDDSDFDYKAYAAAFSLGEEDDSCSGECCQCIASSSQWYMNKMDEKWKSYCQKTKCPFVRKMCSWAEAHPKHAFGYLLDHSHTAGMSFAYCAGKGVCHMTPETTTRADAFVVEEARRLQDDEGDMDGCMQKAMRKAMRWAIKRRNQWCKSTDCPRAKKMCQWFETHEEEAMGMLVSREQPWKFALGKCH